MPPKKRSSQAAVDSLRHKDTRKNIPTEELRGFLRDEDGAEKTVLYPRDPSLDPQLVWKGKDEQDRQDLAVPALPVYIQEKIHPQAIIDDLMERHAGSAPPLGKGGLGGVQLNLFDDFNGLDFAQKIDFYRHDSHWSNRMILGDSLLVMTSLAEKEGLKGQVQTIYLDPPYGIKFGSNWQVSTRKRDVKDGKAEDATRQPEQVRAFRDTWELGIHSYLAYLRDRLVVARELLTESGSVFVQIGDENLHLIRSLLDEVFGTENFFALIAFKSSNPLGSSGLPKPYDFIVWYARSVDHIKFRPLLLDKDVIGDKEYRFFEDLPSPDAIRRLTEDEVRALGKHPPVFRRQKLTSSGYTKSCTFDFTLFGRQCKPMTGKSWSTNEEGIGRLKLANRLFFTGQNPAYKRYYNDAPFQQLDNCWSDMAGAEEQVYVVQTGTKFVDRCLLMTTDPGDLVLDPTCGSGTTAYVAEQWGRRWITCDTSRVALALARTRLMAARFPYYLLADSPEGIAREAEVTGQTPPPHRTDSDVKKGFVYRRVPHVTLKAIANNEEIDVIHAKWQERLEPLRARINAALGTSYEEWEVPRELPESSANPQASKGRPRRQSADSEAPETLLAEWWDLRRQRQKQIDASIARRAEQELLYDQPYEDGKRVRVAGPFTVESLSPHRRLTVQEKVARAEGRDGLSVRTIGPDRFGHMILENLKKAGIQTRERRERLKFDSLDPFAGEWIHAAGTFTDAEGEVKRVAVCIGPEHGTVGPDLVREAAKEAVQGTGFDLLYLCGFAFDPHVDEETKRYGRLNIQICRMNPDLSMGDELLKKTGAGNLFMVFGEPDITIRTAGGRILHGPQAANPPAAKGNGSKRPGAAARSTQAGSSPSNRDTQPLTDDLVVEIRGVDVYDPTTGQIRSASTDDIACWFIDTEYDGESFFVRHAYFTGAGDPYERLRKALRAEIDESAWSALYSTTSQPFSPPTKGKIAVKVINHYGDEVLKVYSVS